MKKEIKLNDKRIEALARQDAVKYASLCDIFGIAPEDFSLYERGQAEVIAQEEKDNSITRIDYSSFLEEVSKYGINIGHLDMHSDAKMKLLKKYFPIRFGDGGSQPLRDYSLAEIGKVFIGVIRYANKKNRDKK